MREKLVDSLTRLTKIKFSQLIKELKIIKPSIIGTSNSIKTSVINEYDVELIKRISDRLFSEMNYEHYGELLSFYQGRIYTYNFVLNTLFTDDDKDNFTVNVCDNMHVNVDTIHYLCYLFEQHFNVSIDTMVETYFDMISLIGIKGKSIPSIQTIKAKLINALDRLTPMEYLDLISEIRDKSAHLLDDKFELDIINLSDNKTIETLNYYLWKIKK